VCNFHPQQTMRFTPGVTPFETLASSLVEDIGSACDRTRSVTAEARVCKELLLSISVLLPKLQAARYVLPDQELQPERAVRRAYDGCDEG